MTRLPALFLPHGGGPCFFMDWSPPDEWDRMAGFLRDVDAGLPARPSALVVISGHWEEPEITIQKNPVPDLLFDYHGFPPHTYELTWPAPGAPELSDRIAGLLDAAGIDNRFDTERGYDHGVFIPLKLAWPKPDIPVVQVSLRSDLDPSAHLDFGRALSPLRDENILIIGSGMSFHNMQILMRNVGQPKTEQPTHQESILFDDWLTNAVRLSNRERENVLKDWALAPAALAAHPREEHLLPLHVVAGTALEDLGRQIFPDVVLGAAVSAYGFGVGNA